MDDLLKMILAGVLSGSVISSILGFFLYKRTARMAEDIKSEYARQMAVFQSSRAWREKSVSELLAPLYMQFERTEKAFSRWNGKNLIKCGRNYMGRLVFVALLFFTLTACKLPQAARQTAPTVDAGMVGTIAAQTLEAMYTPGPTLTGTPLPSSTPNVTVTMTPTITPTYETPTARFEGDTNCRGGPGTAYQVITVARSGQKAEIVGKAEQGNFWLIKNPNGQGTCWVAGDFAQTSGSVHILPTVTAPPTPTAAPPKAPAWQSWTYSCAFASGGSNATVQLAWSDTAQNEEGYNVYRNEQVVASFGPNTTAYTDVTFVTAGGSLTYVVEVYSPAGRARSSPVTVTCQ